MRVDFNKLDPVERRLILIASHEKYEALKNEIPWEKFLWLIPAYFFPFAFIRSFTAISYERLRELLRRGEIPIPHLSPKEATGRFGFDFGHPQDGAAYVLHPVNPEYYLVPAITNEKLAQEKVSAFLDLTASLGARRLIMTSSSTLDDQSNGTINIAAEAARVGIKISQNFTAHQEELIYREFDRPKHPPMVPEHVKKWLQEDSGFRSIAYARLEEEIIKDYAQLRIENKVDISSSVTLGLTKYNIDAGGKLKNIISIAFGFLIEYWPTNSSQ